MKLDLERIERDIQRAHGALEQVGGAVARERLLDATEAFELAERQEREIEAEYGMETPARPNRVLGRFV